MHDGRLVVATAQREQAERAAAVADQEVPTVRGAEREAEARVEPAFAASPVAASNSASTAARSGSRTLPASEVEPPIDDTSDIASCAVIRARARSPRRNSSRDEATAVGQEVEHLELRIGR